MVCNKEMEGSWRDQKEEQWGIKMWGGGGWGGQEWSRMRGEGEIWAVRRWYIPFDKACWSSESDITPLRSLSTLGRRTQIRYRLCQAFHTPTHLDTQWVRASTVTSWNWISLSACLHLNSSLGMNEALQHSRRAVHSLENAQITKERPQNESECWQPYKETCHATGPGRGETRKTKISRKSLKLSRNALSWTQ